MGWNEKKVLLRVCIKKYTIMHVKLDIWAGTICN